MSIYCGIYVFSIRIRSTFYNENRTNEILDYTEDLKNCIKRDLTLFFPYPYDIFEFSLH